MISALFKWQFIASKNILFVCAEFHFQDFVLIFDDTKKCNKVHSFLIEKGVIVGNHKLIKERLLPPLFTELSTNNESSLKMKEILLKWIDQHDGKEKEEYIQLLKNFNIYDIIYQKRKEISIKSQRKRNVKEMMGNFRESENQNSYSQGNGMQSPPPKKPNFSHINLSNRIIVKPNFEHIEFQHLGITRQRLFIFSTNDKNKCYEYYWDNCERSFQCCACARKVKRVKAALCQRSDGTQIVKCGKARHVCEMREYKPEKYIFDPLRDIVKSLNTRKMEIIKRCKKKQCVLAKICKNSDGDDYVKLHKNEHVCDLREFDPSKFKSDIVLSNSMYEFIKCIVSKVSKKNLIIFTSNEKKYYYKFTYDIAHKNFYCSKCYTREHGVRAYICKNENDEEYISLRDKQHICEPLEYSQIEGKIVKPPGYETIKRRHGGKWLQRLVVFDEKDKNYCYEYRWNKSQKAYVCCLCSNKKVNVQAKIIKNNKEEEYVQMYQNDHICKPRKYVPEDLTLKIIRRPNFKVEKCITRGVEYTYLFVNDSNDNSLCYKYVFNKKQNRFQCRQCRTRCVSAKLHHQDKNGEEYVELSKTEHECQPIKYTKSKIVNHPNFKVHEIGKVLFIFTDNDKAFCYTYHYQPSIKYFVCRKCKTKKLVVSAWLRSHQNGEQYVEMGENDHICEPEKYESQESSAIKTIFKPNFKVVNNGAILIINDPKTKQYCYQYNYWDSLKKYVCNRCQLLKKRTTAKILQNENAEDYVAFGRTKHFCQSKKL